jgi:hypothetical protein
LQVKLERTHRQKKKINRLQNKRDQMVDRKKKIPSIYIKQITHLQSGNQTAMELRNRTVGLRQQVEHSHYAQIPNQNSQRPSKCTLVCNKSTLHTHFNIPYVIDVIHERINKRDNKLGAQPNPLLEPLLQSINTRKQKRCWPLDCKTPVVTSPDEYPITS